MYGVDFTVADATQNLTIPSGSLQTCISSAMLIVNDNELRNPYRLAVDIVEYQIFAPDTMTFEIDPMDRTLISVDDSAGKFS